MVGFSFPIQRSEIWSCSWALFPLPAVFPSPQQQSGRIPQAEEWDRHVEQCHVRLCKGAAYIWPSLGLRFLGTVVWCLRKQVLPPFLPCFQAATAPALIAVRASLVSRYSLLRLLHRDTAPAPDSRYWLRQRSVLPPECPSHKPGWKELLSTEGRTLWSSLVLS